MPVHFNYFEASFLKISDVTKVGNLSSHRDTHVHHT
jgi:hypothetical protein